jgi:Na+/H+ antiporter NhaD/arsenite permease-like protein
MTGSTGYYITTVLLCMGLFSGFLDNAPLVRGLP